jgi:thymidylate synthase
VQEQLSRSTFPLPKLVLKRKPDSVFEYRYEDIEIVGYECHAAIKAPVSV